MSRFVSTLRRVLDWSGNVVVTVIVVVFSVSSLSVSSVVLVFVVIGSSLSSRVGISVVVAVVVEASSIGVAVVCVGAIGVPFPVLNSVVLATVFLAMGVVTVSMVDDSLATDDSSAMGVSSVMSMLFAVAVRVSSCFEK